MEVTVRARRHSSRRLPVCLLRRAEGIVFRGEPITGLSPDHIIGKGIASVPEGRELFGTMTVWDNLLLGSYSMTNRARKQMLQGRLDMVFLLFPILKERLRQRADTLSGGQQQMLAIGRALMAGPKLLALDEPSLGLISCAGHRGDESAQEDMQGVGRLAPPR